jgi:nucleotide-binding universal stress UspA family protein
VHVVAGPVGPPWLRRRLTGRTGSGREGKARRLASLVAARARVSTRVWVVEGSPADMIPAIANRHRTPLLLMLLRGRRRWFESGRGALAYRIGVQVNVPVLACPPRWRPR